MGQASGIWELLLVVGFKKEKPKVKLWRDGKQGAGLMYFWQV